MQNIKKLLFVEGEVNIVKYLTIFTEPEENNNCFSIISIEIISQVIIRATAFSFILLISSLKTSRNRAVANLKISGSVL